MSWQQQWWDDNCGIWQFTNCAGLSAVVVNKIANVAVTQKEQKRTALPDSCFGKLWPAAPVPALSHTAEVSRQKTTFCSLCIYSTLYAFYVAAKSTLKCGQLCNELTSSSSFICSETQIQYSVKTMDSEQDAPGSWQALNWVLQNS